MIHPSVRKLSILMMAALAAFATATTSRAQIATAPKELGMAGAYTGMARGYEALPLNPANLGLSDAPAWSVGLSQLTLGGTLVGPRFGDVMDMIEYDEQSPDRRDELLSLIPASGTAGAFTFRAPLVSFTTGGFGFGATYATAGHHTLDRDVVELLLEGYEDGRTDYSADETRGERATYWDFSGSYGRQIGALALGATAHYIRGGKISQTRMSRPRVNVEAREIEVDYIGVDSRGGTGYAVDLGAAYEVTSGLTLSAAVSNVVSSMRWNDDLHYRILELDRESIDGARPLQLRAEYGASDRQVPAESLSAEVAETAEGLLDDADLPAVARIGLGWRVRPGTHLAADVHHRMSDGRLADAWKQRFAVGVQQEVSVFKLRAGYARGSEGSQLLGGGLSIGALDIGVARYNAEALAGANAEGWVVTLGIGTSQMW